MQRAHAFEGVEDHESECSLPDFSFFLLAHGFYWF